MDRYTDHTELSLFIMLGILFIIMAACLGVLLHNEWKLYQVRQAYKADPILDVWSGEAPVTVSASQYLRSIA